MDKKVALMRKLSPHQYVNGRTGKIETEEFYADRMIHFLYSHVRERAPILFNMVISPRFSSFIGFLHFDCALQLPLSNGEKYFDRLGIKKAEIYELPKKVTVKNLFERKICYWDCRPMTDDPDVIVSPADAKAFVGSLNEKSAFFLKEKFFHWKELLGDNQVDYHDLFRHGDYAVFRLTPDKYHYNHFPVSGCIDDFYVIEGHCHSCNPIAPILTVTPYSKNRRTVTIINTDVEGGTQIGKVAMIEITALMIGAVEQRYSEQRYDNPKPLEKGLFVKKGQPKSLYKPGSSVDVIFFQKDTITFKAALLNQQQNHSVENRYALLMDHPLVETDVVLRESIARKN